MNCTIRPIQVLMVFVVAVTLAACAADEETYKEAPVERLYNQAISQLEAGEHELAAAAFSEVDRQHPYSVWATKAQLMAAYSHYQNNDYDDAIIALDRFIQIHPSNRDVPYAYYLKSLSYYEQISDVGRDQKMTQLALKSLGEIVTRFPNSKYSRDAALKIDLTRDHLAGKEMEIGRYYENQGQYLGAINRYKKVVDQFQTTTHVPEALHRLTESYLSLGLVAEAKKTAAVLGHNFPGSEWYIDSYEIVEGKSVRPKVKASRWYWPFD
ncbi:MAG: outer membrane protein assembly factor BamD [Rhodospirillaceae bacterium]|jgi:outer membrane protein assembly factor BamD|nr:outer membrane protein assembly factor BamD [Rhodospirillaceae bacterium]MBT5941991.1 outer membrane protein assembly factor BamD [Rhodospirillaceae bacterium]